MNRWHVALIGLLLLTSGVYVFGLWTAGFVWDDVPLIVMNNALGHLERVPLLFAGDLWAASGAGQVESGYYRPLVLLSFSLDKAIFGDAALGYHLHSLAWHLLAVTALFVVIKDITGESGALLGATVFALHPVQSECVAWISARNDLMAAALGLLAILALQVRGRSALRWWLGALLAMGAMLSKESAVILPLLLLILDCCRDREDRALWGGQSALLLGIALALGLRALAGVGGAALPPAVGWELFCERFFDWVGIMAASVAWPMPVTSARDLHWTDLEPPSRIWIGWVCVCLCALVAALHRGIARRAAAGGLIWVVAGMALTVVPLADKGGYGDRFWYLPLFGIALLLAAVVPRRLAPWMAAALAVPAVVTLTVRLPDWDSDVQMWAAASRDVPSPVNHVGLGHSMLLDGHVKRAHVAFVGALTTDRLANDACSRVIGSAVRMGLLSHGVRMGHWAVSRGCLRDADLTGWLATAEALTGDWEAAEMTLGLGLEEPSGRGLVVAAALLLHQGDQAAFTEAVGGRAEIERKAILLVTEAARRRSPE